MQHGVRRAVAGTAPPATAAKVLACSERRVLKDARTIQQRSVVQSARANPLHEHRPSVTLQCTCVPRGDEPKHTLSWSKHTLPVESFFPLAVCDSFPKLKLFSTCDGHFFYLRIAFFCIETYGILILNFEIFLASPQFWIVLQFFLDLAKPQSPFRFPSACLVLRMGECHFRPWQLLQASNCNHI